MDTPLTNQPIAKERSTCRICGGPLKEVIDLGELSISTFLAVQQEPPKIPMTLMSCTQCDLVQLKHTINGDIMYRDYWYKSGLNASMVAALKDVVDKTVQYVRGTIGTWIDIGSNDNTMLKYVQDKYPDFETVGFDPTYIDRHRVDNFFNTYFSAAEYFKYFGDTELASVVTSIACFYDMEDPTAFVQDVKRVLAPDGVFVIQMMDMLSMWKTHDFANICHEHLEYYTLDVLKTFLEGLDLVIFDVEYNAVNGGSLRVYVAHASSQEHPIQASVDEALREERQWFAQFDDPFAYFRDTVSTIRERTVQFIKNVVKRGQTIAVFGASTKGNTILQYFGLDNRWIDHAAEVNSDKFGLRTVATHIHIISQADSLDSHPDYYFVLPHGFIKFFIDTHMDYLRKGGKFLVALPQPAVISVDAQTGSVVWDYL